MGRETFISWRLSPRPLVVRAGTIQFEPTRMRSYIDVQVSGYGVWRIIGMREDAAGGAEVGQADTEVSTYFYHERCKIPEYIRQINRTSQRIFKHEFTVTGSQPRRGGPAGNAGNATATLAVDPAKVLRLVGRIEALAPAAAPRQLGTEAGNSTYSLMRVFGPALWRQATKSDPPPAGGEEDDAVRAARTATREMFRFLAQDFERAAELEHMPMRMVMWHQANPSPWPAPAFASRPRPNRLVAAITQLGTRPDCLRMAGGYRRSPSAPRSVPSSRRRRTPSGTCAWRSASTPRRRWTSSPSWD